MSESFESPVEQHEDTQSKIDTLRSLLRSNVAKYSDAGSENISLGAQAQAFLEALDAKPYFRELVETMFDIRSDVSPAHGLKLLDKSYCSDLMTYDPNFPRGYEQPETWLKAIDEIDDDPLTRWGQLQMHLLTRRVQSNVAERYKSIKLLAAVLSDRYDEPPSHLDVGSSVMHGDIKLVYNRASEPARLPFGPIELTKKEKKSDETTDYIQRLANTALKQHVEFGAVMGVDITNVDDPVTKQWIKSCSFYPDELLNESKVAEYSELDKLDPQHERVRFFRGDFTNLDFKEFKDQSPVDTYDIITFSTIFYQVSRQEQTAMLVTASQLLSEKGIIVIQDAPDGDFAKKYNYITSVIDSTDDNPTEKPMIRWENGRCERAIFELGKLSIRGKYLTLAEALEEIYS